jgi:aspartate/methionine/tyrosine aminotransferase
VPDRVEGAIGPETALVVVTNRHNPSGCRTVAATLEELAKIVSRYDAYLHVDEVFSPFVTETPDAPRTAFGGTTAAALPNTVVTNSLTKFHGLYDVNIGWAVGDEGVVDRVRHIEDHTNVVARPNREMARRALTHTDHFLAETRQMLRERHDLLAAFVSERPDLDGSVHDDHTFAFLDHERADGDEVAEAAATAGVGIVPGRFFGDSDRFRVSLGYGVEESSEGLDRLGDALDER